MSESATAWFTEVELPGLRDYWSVYDAQWDDVQRDSMPAILAHRTFGPLIAAMPKEQLDAQNADSRAKLRRAIEGHWDEYEADLRMQGALYAGLGVEYRDWYDIVRLVSQILMPRLVKAYGSDLPRLTGALQAMQSLFDRAMAVIAESYIRAKEQALRESERRLSITLDSIGDAVIATDATGLVVRMNPVAARLTGHSPDRACGKPLTEVFRIESEDTGETARSPVERVLTEGVVVGLANHTALIRPDGTRVPIADSAAPIKDADGITRGVVLVFRDITEERTAERARARSAELELDNRKIQEANRLKSEFLANMSHELRTPLNAIIGFSELLFDGVVDPSSSQYREFVGDILSSGRHLLQLINDILDLSKVEAGKMEFRPEKVDLNVLLDEVGVILRGQAASKRIRIEREVDASLDSVMLDPARFKQVLFNYLSNALKFTPEGGRVSVRARAEGSHAFRLEVEDTGAGIAPEDLERLFVEFQQLEAGSAKRHGGTGLGLALTRKLAEAQGGSAGVRSTLGAGSVFHVVLPRHSRTSAALPTPSIRVASDVNAPRILVIEDDARDQAFLVRTLSEAGYAVETAATGAQALMALRERTFDAVTLDLLLPDVTGVDVLRAIRGSDRHRNVPVVIVSVAAERSSAAGFTVHDMLAKPVEPGALLESLRRAGLSPDRGLVLVVDDDPASLRLMQATLSQLGYNARCETDGETALTFAAKDPPMAVVLDLLMPGVDGFAFLERFRRRPETRSIPVIIWTVKDLTADEHARLRSTCDAIVRKDGTAAVLEEIRSVLPIRTAASTQ